MNKAYLRTEKKYGVDFLRLKTLIFIMKIPTYNLIYFLSNGKITLISPEPKVKIR